MAPRPAVASGGQGRGESAKTQGRGSRARFGEREFSPFAFRSPKRALRGGHGRLCGSAVVGGGLFVLHVGRLHALDGGAGLDLGGLHSADALGGEAFGAAGLLVLYHFAVLEGAEAFALDAGEMDEDVLALGVKDEAE